MHDSLWIDPDGVFILLPSYMSGVSGNLDEGKVLGKSKKVDADAAQGIDYAALADPAGFTKARARGASVGRSILVSTQKATLDALQTVIDDYMAGRVSAKDLRRSATKTMRKAWKAVFVAGLNSSGLPGAQVKTNVSSDDQQFFKGSMAHEMTYLNSFLDDIVDNTGTMDYKRRASMYVSSLSAFYDNSRVLALPFNVTIRWAGPEDKVTCPSCQYLFNNNIYTKYTLPTVPRSGLTLCLTHCRDRLLVRRIDKMEYMDIIEKQKPRARHVRALERIRAGA